MGKLIYCTRTVPEMTKCVHELKRVISYRDKCLGLSDAASVCAPKAPHAMDGQEATAAQAEALAASAGVVARAAAAPGGGGGGGDGGSSTGGGNGGSSLQGSTFLALCLSSRRNMCIHPQVMAANSDREAVDSLCRDRTASWVRAKAASEVAAGKEPSVETCDFFEEYTNRGSDAVVRHFERRQTKATDQT
jgi:DNA excision repair protein ERCC-2